MNNETLQNKMQTYTDAVISAYGDKGVIGLFLDDLRTLIAQAYKQGVKDALDMPLIQKLSPKERGDLQLLYNQAYSESFSHTTCLDRNYARGGYNILERVFGRKNLQAGLRITH